MTGPIVTLLPTEPEDLPILFQFQRDAQAAYLAAFTAPDSHDQAAYLARYTGFLADPAIHMRTVWVAGKVAGSIASFVLGDHTEITYWFDRRWWGQGLATQALQAFLALEPTRPLHGRTAFGNHGSQRVLEKCGFVRIGQDQGFANARQSEIVEYMYRLA